MVDCAVKQSATLNDGGSFVDLMRKTIMKLIRRRMNQVLTFVLRVVIDCSDPENGVQGNAMQISG